MLIHDIQGVKMKIYDLYIYTWKKFMNAESTYRTFSMMLLKAGDIIA